MVNAAIFQSNTGDPPVLTQARKTTMAALTSLDEQTILNLTQLTLPEIRKIQKEVARVLPAGNLPALILSGLLKLDGRYINRKQVQNDLNALLKGFSLLPKGLYGVFVMGPAAVLYGYQMLLQLSGKEPASAFPEGTWQFYLQFGLREDTARHANETLGFHQSLPAKPDNDKMATAWVLTALDLLYQYDRLLAADWRERVMLRLIQNVANEAQMPPQPMINTLVYNWNKERPYHRTHTGANYLEEREQAFTNFVNQRLTALAPDMITQIQQLYAEREAEELPAYQNQMSILATLKPDSYQERKELIPLRRAAIGFIWNGQTYLMPACQRDKDGSPLCYPADNGAPIPIYTMKDGTLCDGHKNALTISRSGEVRYARNNQYVGNLKRPSDEAVLAWVSAILNTKKPDQAPELDLLLANAPRQQHEQLRKKLPEATQQEIDMWLSRAPLLINWDAHPANQFLGDIRDDHRGIGDHALTLFRTEKSIVFDQSHIFFDGMWGMAVAEIATDTAIHFYKQLKPITHQNPVPTPPALNLYMPPDIEAEIRAACRKTETHAEVIMRTSALTRLRKGLRKRGVRLTVNDILLLARFFHAATYDLSTTARNSLNKLKTRMDADTAGKFLKSVDSILARYKETNPVLLIPMDASNVSPHERLFPTTFRNPLTDILTRFNVANELYLTAHSGPTAANLQAFDRARKELLAYLKAFGEVLDAVKAVTMRGESFNTATIRLLGHLPVSMQHVLDNIPQNISVLNEIIKGNEVFSNVGRVAADSTLNRFTSAKDDGKTKELVWGILTDTQGLMHISLRDFRPFIAPLLDIGANDIAADLTADYLNQYVQTLNNLVDDLTRLITAKVP